MMYNIILWRKHMKKTEMQIIEERLNIGSPELFRKKRFGRFVAENFFCGIGLFLFSVIPLGFFMPCVYLCLAIVEMKDVRSAVKKRGFYGTGYLPTKKSAYFGMNDSRKLNENVNFRVVYILIMALIGFIANAGIVFLWNYLLGEGKFEAILLIVMQTLGLWASNLYNIIKSCNFKHELESVCYQCGWANTIKKTGEGILSSKVEDRAVGIRGGGQYKSGTVYVNGKEVGSLYSNAEGSTVYQQVRITETCSTYTCSHCGNSVQNKGSSMQAIGGRHF